MPAKPKHTHYRPGALAIAADVRQELAKVYRDARQGILDASVATRLTYILATLAKLIEATALEERIAVLERELNALPSRPHGVIHERLEASH
jgi:hypothetical protein